MSKRERVAVVAPRFEVTHSSDFKSCYASGVFGGVDPNDSRLIFYLDRAEPKMIEDSPGNMTTSKIIREILVEIHMSPHQWKSLVNFMAQRLKMLEDDYGEIKIGREEKNDTQMSHIA